MAARTLNRPNTYAAKCVRCGGRVAAEEGLLARTDTGWAADHLGDCPEKPLTVIAPVEQINRDGIYRHPDGTIYKVQQARQGSGRLYAKRLVLDEQPDGSHKGRFVYAAGAVHNLRPGWRLTLEAAAAFGRLYGVCAACAADLTDETSIARGLGPICAGKF